MWLLSIPKHGSIVHSQIVVGFQGALHEQMNLLGGGWQTGELEPTMLWINLCNKSHVMSLVLQPDFLFHMLLGCDSLYYISGVEQKSFW